MVVVIVVEALLAPPPPPVVAMARELCVSWGEKEEGEEEGGMMGGEGVGMSVRVHYLLAGMDKAVEW